MVLRNILDRLDATPARRSRLSGHRDQWPWHPAGGRVIARTASSVELGCGSMHRIVKYSFIACVTLAACGLDEPLSGDDKTADEPADEPVAPEATGIVEQALGAMQESSHGTLNIGGDLSAKDFDLPVGRVCSPGFVRVEGPGEPMLQGNFGGGGYCYFSSWITPSNPHDCSALIHIHTPGGWFSGSCTYVIHEIEEGPRQFFYAAANTSNANVNSTMQPIVLGQGQTLTIGTTDVPGSSANGDTFLRLLYPYKYPYFQAVADENDDAHPPARGSLISFTAPTTGTYTIVAGCWSNTSCSGTVAWTITP